MFLADTNIFLEILLGQDKKEPAAGLRDFALWAAPLHLEGAGLKSLRSAPHDG
jgi:hypothetical protein